MHPRSEFTVQDDYKASIKSKTMAAWSRILTGFDLYSILSFRNVTQIYESWEYCNNYKFLMNEWMLKTFAQKEGANIKAQRRWKDKHFLSEEESCLIPLTTSPLCRCPFHCQYQWRHWMKESKNFDGISQSFSHSWSPSALDWKATPAKQPAVNMEFSAKHYFKNLSMRDEKTGEAPSSSI